MTLELWQLAYFYLIGLALALLEIEIEGGDGWAKNLPTKKIKFWWTKKSGKEITGYHLILNIFLLLFMHLPLIFEKRFSLELEILIIAQYLFFIVYWDYLWFILNPKFRLKNFKKGGVPWHKSWILGLPMEYWLALSGAIFLPAIFFGWSAIWAQLLYLATYFVFILLTIIFFWAFARKRL